MILFSGLVKYNKSGKIDDVKVVGDDFSWKSLFLNPFWFLYHRMWFEALFYAAIMLTLSYFEDSYFEKFGLSSFIISLAIAIVVAWNAKKWYKENLLKRHKYKLVAEIFGNHPAEAKVKLINQLISKDHPEHSEIFSSDILNPQKNKKKS